MTNKTQNTPSVSVSYLRVVLNYCQNRGISESDLCKEAGVDPAQLQNTEERIARIDSINIFKAAARLLGDPDIGLHAGQESKPGYLGALGISLMSAQSIEQALELGLRYQSLVADGLKMAMEIEGDEVRVILQPESDSVEFSKVGIDAFVSGLVRLARSSLGDHLNPSWIALKIEKPENIEAYENLFKCLLNFDQKQTIVAFPKKYLEMDFMESNPEILEIMKPNMEKQLRHFQEGDEAPWLTDCRNYIASHLCHGNINKDAIAQHLSLSPRQLRRQLEGEGLNVTTLIENTRSELAQQFIEDKDKSLLDITYLLGYKEQASFQKAFKQWTGSTPGEYRRNRLSS